MPETNHVSRVYSVAAILLVSFVLHVILIPMSNVLFFCITTYQSMCEVFSMAVVCSSLISGFPSMLLTYFLNDFEMVSFAPIITGNTCIFTFHIHCISIGMSLYFTFLASFIIIIIPIFKCLSLLTVKFH